MLDKLDIKRNEIKISQHNKITYLVITFLGSLCNALIQPHFDYACSAWYPNLNKNLTKKMQTAQNKCIRECGP